MGEESGGERLTLLPGLAVSDVNPPAMQMCCSNSTQTTWASLRGWVSVGVFRSELGSKEFVISEFCGIKKRQG